MCTERKKKNEFDDEQVLDLVTHLFKKFPP